MKALTKSFCRVVKDKESELSAEAEPLRNNNHDSGSNMGFKNISIWKQIINLTTENWLFP
jgi:hypothetical protein